MFTGSLNVNLTIGGGVQGRRSCWQCTHTQLLYAWLVNKQVYKLTQTNTLSPKPHIRARIGCCTTVKTDLYTINWKSTVSHRLCNFRYQPLIHHMWSMLCWHGQATSMSKGYPKLISPYVYESIHTLLVAGNPPVVACGIQYWGSLSADMRLALWNRYRKMINQLISKVYLLNIYIKMDRKKE
jgi:hypothetical protein